MKNSSTHDDEVDHHPKNQENGIGRSYECVFCKRGFNTAQALGGHMNIHRKDRVRTNRSSQNNGPYHVPTTHISYRSFLPARSSTSTADSLLMNGPDGDNNNRAQCLNLLLQQFGETMEKNKEILEDDLDLELRLGYDP